jgi:hypothetical protein
MAAAARDRERDARVGRHRRQRQVLYVDHRVVERVQAQQRCLNLRKVRLRRGVAPCTGRSL